MQDDLLYDCAAAYKELMNYEYKIELTVKKKIKSFNIVFEAGQFKHLSGLEKLKDISEFRNNSSKALLEKILNHDITTQSIMNSSFINTRINDNTASQTDYYVIDRLTELKTLYDKIHNIDNNNFCIHIWDKNCTPQYRPHHSKISADYFLEFKNSSTNKSELEVVCTFFIEDREQTKATGVSIFPTDLSYSDDGSISVERCTILSVKEKNISLNQITDLITAPPELIEKAYADSLNKAQYITIKNDIKVLKKKRIEYFERKNEKTEMAYNKKLAVFKNPNIYSPEMLDIVIQSLKAQLESPNNVSTKHLIEHEISDIENEMSQNEHKSDITTSSSISIVKNTTNRNGTISVTPIITVQPPQQLIKGKNIVEKTSHLISSSINGILSDITKFVQKILVHQAISPNKEPPQKNFHISKRTAHQSKKYIQDITKDTKSVPMFSLSDLKSEKYAPSSQKDKNKEHKKNNDIEI